MMFKLMRACIDIENVEDLWYRQLDVVIHEKKKLIMTKSIFIQSNE